MKALAYLVGVAVLALSLTIGLTAFVQVSNLPPPEVTPALLQKSLSDYARSDELGNTDYVEVAKNYLKSVGEAQGLRIKTIKVLSVTEGRNTAIVVVKLTHQFGIVQLKVTLSKSLWSVNEATQTG